MFSEKGYEMTNLKHSTNYVYLLEKKKKKSWSVWRNQQNQSKF